MIDNTITLLQKIEKEAINGQRVWRDLKDKYSISSSDAIIIMSDESELNKLVIDNLPNYQKRKAIECSYIIVDELLETSECSNKYNIIPLSKDDINAIKRYYRAIQFTQNIVVVSLELPYATEGIVGIEGITLEDFVKDAILV